MSEDWKPGDLAVCVDARCKPWLRPLSEIVEGRCYRVSWVGLDLDDGEQILQLRGVNSTIDTFTGAYDHRRFRKLNDEPDDIALIQRIKRCKPVKGHEHV